MTDVIRDLLAEKAGCGLALGEAMPEISREDHRPPLHAAGSPDLASGVALSAVEATIGRSFQSRR